MAVLVDPRTGDQYDASNPPPGFDPNEYGLVSPEEYARQQEAKNENPIVAGARAGAASILAPAAKLTDVLAGAAGALAPANAPNAGVNLPTVEEASRPFLERAKAAEQAHPLASFLGQAVPMGMVGALSGGVGEAVAGAAGVSPAIGAGAGLLAESGVLGASQEAVDAVADPQKRDFSWRAALMNGGLNLLFGAAFHGAGKLLGGEASALGGRNILAELDPGEVPEAVPGGTRGRAAPGEPRAAMSGGAAAANFDELPAAQSIEELRDGKVSPGPLAEAAPAIRQQLSLESARSADALDDFLKNDANLAVKHQDFAPGAAEWTPAIVDAQNQWVATMAKEAREVADTVANTEHAGGLGKAASAEVLKGLDRVEAAGDDLAARNVAIDNWKRGVDGFIDRLGNYGNQAVDQETRSGLIRELRERLSDELRAGLENPDLFGRNAELQAAHNGPLHELIDPLKRVQKKLYEVTGRTWGELGASAVERRADPDAFRRLFEDPHLGGQLFQRDLADALDHAESLARGRQEAGLSRLEGLPGVIEQLQQIRDDMNTAQVLHVAEGLAGGGAHGAGLSTGEAIGANALLHAVEFGGRAVGFPVGQVARSMGAMSKIGRGIRAARKALGFESSLAGEGTATRALLDRYAQRVQGSELLADPAHRALMPETLRTFLDQSHAPAPPIPPGAPGGQGSGNPPSMPPGAPGSPANDVAGKVAALAAVGGAGALLAPATASAAELGPDGQTLSPQQAAARAALRAQMQGLDPSEQAQQIRTAEAFARIGKQVEQRTTAAVTDLFRVAKDPNAPPRFQSPEARQLSARAEDLGTTRSMARFMGKNVDDPVQAWREKSDQLGKLVSDPSGLANAMAAHLGDLPRLQPEIYTAMVSRTMQAAEYLFDKLPAPVGKTPLMPNGYPPSLEDIQSFAGHWAGTLHPLDALDDLAANDLVPEQMQAVKEFWPESYELFRQNALSQIYQLGQKRGPLPLVALQQIDGALDLDGAGQPALSGEMAALITQATQQAAAQGKPPPSPSPAQANSQAPARIASSALGSIHGDATG